MVAIFLSAPERFSEVFRLPVNCEHDDVDEDGKPVYGLRWVASKGGGALLNWIPSDMVETCKEAVDRLRTHTEEARLIAKWYDDNPHMLYLPSDLEYLRGEEYISSRDLCKLLGVGKTDHACRWANERKLEAIKVRPEGGIGAPANAYRFVDIEKAIIEMLPMDFPICDEKTGLKYSESLLVIPYNMLHIERGSYRCLFQTISVDAFNDQIGAGVKYGKSSIFSRHGYTEPDGSIIELTSKKFRHFLVTLALKKNLSYAIATLWRKSKDIRQTKAYDHVSCDQVIEIIRHALPEQINNSLTEIAVNPPVSRNEFMEIMYPCVHTTQFGFCVHDWQMLPCQKLSDCLACTEHVCIKGDTKKTERIRLQLKDAEAQLARDEDAIAVGELGADRWVTHNRKQVERLRQLVNILDDPAVAEGTIIQFHNPEEFSFIGHAVDTRRQLGDADAAALNKIRALSPGDKEFSSGQVTVVAK